MNIDDPFAMGLLVGRSTRTIVGGGGGGVAAVGLVIDGGGAVITPGVKGFFPVPFVGTITGVTVLSTDPAVTPGSIVIDVWKAGFSSYPPTAANSITAAARPTLVSAVKSVDTTLSGWTKTIAAGDVLGFSVLSAALVTRVTIELAVQG